ncbi:MAG: DUF4159 domain-containing protein [Gammaproteobacteria bacterium]|nr:DUF4159 domain-containing protein [Gammaproteobacteria bacterium]
MSKRRGTRPELRLRLGVAAFLWMLGLGAWAQFFTEPAQETARPTVERLEHEFYFTRGIYTSGDRDEWVPRWAVDYPKADQQFLVALRRLTAVDAFDSEHALALYGDELGDFPFVYALEVGSLNLDEQQALALRRYLLSGGFLVIDDFWGSWDWEHFKAQMLRVFPEHEIVEVPLEHPVFHAFYDIADILQVPNVRQADGGPTHELDGIVPHVRGIFDDKGRLMVLINWNTDLGDAWEWADLPQYPLRYSTYAYEMGINFVIYAMTH